MRSILHSPVVCEEEDGIMSGEFWMAGNKIFLLCVKFDKTRLTAPGKNDMIIAIIRIPDKSSGVQSAHGCVVVLGGRQPARVLRLALRALPSPLFLSRILKLAIVPYRSMEM